MPQVKARTTWLKNMKKVEPPKFIGIDNSEVHIENNLAEDMMRRELDDIHLQAHRAMADRIFELNQTKKDVDNYRRIKDLASSKNVQALLVKRKEQLRNNQTQIITGAPQNSATPIQRPKTAGFGTRKGFSQIEICDSDDEDLYQCRRHKAESLSTTVLVPTTTAHPTRSKRRSRTPHPARSIRQIRKALEDEFSGNRKNYKRPYTTLGFVESDKAKENSEKQDSSLAGRSFHELRDLTHVDHLNKDEIQRTQDLSRQMREMHLEQERQEIQHKIRVFYQRLDHFKRDYRKITSTMNTFH